MGMTTIKSRIGNFTSSGIVALTSNGKKAGEVGAPFKTYVEEKNMERRLGRSIETEVDAKSLTWGKLSEKYVGNNPALLGLEYSVNMDETTVHPDFECWAGSDDATKEDTACDIKAPKTLKSYCQLVDAVYVHGLEGMAAMNHIRENHKEGEKYYQQIVSNCCIHNKPFGELIVFVPYLSQLNELRALAAQMDNPGEYKYAWVCKASDEELPYLLDGGMYKNLTAIRFSVSDEDKKFLTDRVVSASKLLVKV